MEELLKRLFVNAPSGSRPQLGWARPDKKGDLWLPGKNRAVMERVSAGMNLPIRGCTQLAFESWWRPAPEQKCWVCWVGLDIDSDDNPGVNLVKWADGFVSRHPTSMVRLSCGGSGLHMIWILERAIGTNNAMAGRIVKNIAGRFKKLAEDDGVHVCQANRRMFWLDGGKNQTIYQSDFMLKLEDNFVSESVSVKSPALSKLSPVIKKWVDLFIDRKVLRGLVGKSNPIYVGDAVVALRGAGERVDTKSKMSGNGQVNGYIDIDEHRISVWSYADGHVIWNYTDVGAML